MDEIEFRENYYQALMSEFNPSVCSLNLSRRITALNRHIFNDRNICQACEQPETTIKHTCLNDWRFLKSYDALSDDHRCLCGQPIKDLYYIHRENTICQIGSACIFRFGYKELLLRLKEVRNEQLRRKNVSQRKTYECIFCAKRNTKGIVCPCHAKRKVLLDTFINNAIIKINSIQCLACQKTFVKRPAPKHDIQICPQCDKIHFGKFNGQNWSDIRSNKDYLQFIITNLKRLSHHTKATIQYFLCHQKKLNTDAFYLKL